MNRRSADAGNFATIEGAVHGPTGDPIVGARLFVTDIGTQATSGQTLGAVTNAQGNFRTSTSMGTYLVEVYSDGLVAARTTVAVRRAQPYHVEFSLLPGSTLHGRALSALDGNPVRFATVQVVTEKDATPRTTCTDSVGRFDFAELPPGLVRVYAATPEYSTYEGTSVLLKTAQAATDVELRLSPAFSISGQVLDPHAENRPIAGAQLEARDADTGLPVPFQANSDTSGAFTLLGVAPGRYSITAIHDHFQSELAEQLVEVVDTDVFGQLLPMRRGFSVSGRIHPAARANVTLQSIDAAFGQFLEREQRFGDRARATQANADGLFEVQGVTPGKYRVIAEAPDGQHGETLVEVQVGDPTVIEVNIAPRASIYGRVIDAHGRAARNIVVTAEPALSLGTWARQDKPSSQARSGERHSGVAQASPQQGPQQGPRHAITDWAGEFAMFGLPEGDYELRAHTASGYHRIQGSTSTEPGSATPKVVRLRANRRTDLELVLKPCDGTISGVVQYSDSTVAAFAPIEVSPTIDSRDAALEGIESYSVVADARGHFYVGALCGTSYRLVAASNGQYAEQFGVPTGAVVPLQLSHAGSLAGTVSHNGQGQSRFVLDLAGPVRRRERLHSEDGSFVVSWLPPGMYQVGATTADAYAEAKLVIEADSTSPIDLVMHSWSSIRGSLACGNGRPLGTVDLTLLLDRSTERVSELGSASWAINTSSTHADTSGQFRFGRLRSGHGRLMFFESMRELQLHWARGTSKTGPQIGPSPWLEFEVGAEQELDLGTVLLRCP